MTSPAGRASGGLLFPVVVSVLIAGCAYTTTDTVTLSPLHTKYPVSASPEYVSTSGKLVRPKDYDVLTTFNLHRTIRGSGTHETTTSSLELDSDVDRLVAASGGDAVTEMKIEGVDYDRGSHRSSASWKLVGWTFAITSVPFFIGGIAAESSRDQTILVASGAGILGIGLLTYLMSFTTTEPPAWQFEISGRTVRHKPPAVPPPEAPATPSPDASAAPTPGAPATQ